MQINQPITPGSAARIMSFNEWILSLSKSKADQKRFDALVHNRARDNNRDRWGYRRLRDRDKRQAAQELYSEYLDTVRPK